MWPGLGVAWVVFSDVVKGEGGSVSPGYERNAAIIIGPIGHLIGVFVSGTTATAVLRERSP